MNQLGRALRWFRPEAHRLAIVLLLLLGAIGAALLKPWPLAVLVDSVLGGRPVPLWLRTVAEASSRESLIGMLAGCVLLLHLVQSGLATAQNYVSAQIGLNALRRVRDAIFACLLRLSLRFVHGAKSGELTQRAALGAYAFPTLFQQGVVQTVAAILSLLLMLVVMGRIDVILTLVVFMVVPLLLAAIKYFNRGSAERGAKAQQAENQIAGFVQQSIVALPLVQSYAREEHETSAFNARTIAAMQRREVQIGWELSYWLVVGIVFAAGTSGLVWLGAKEVLEGKLTIGQLLVFLAYLPLVYQPIRHLSQSGAILREAIDGTERVFEILDTTEEVRESPRARPVVAAARPGLAGPARKPATLDPRTLAVSGNIEFEKVTFGDQREPVVLDDVSFRLSAGQSTAIVGAATAARTALLNLLPRFHDPTAGVVRLEGIDIRELRLRDLRAQITLVPPDPILLPASIAENIAYGKPLARRGEIEAAAGAAHADRFINQLPNGYLTIIGEGGTRLSPAERHRLNLARAFLRDAPILLLEEPAAEFDAESEELAAASLRELMKGRTTLIVSQRAGTLQHVDQTLVLRDGKLFHEDGAPERDRCNVPENV